MSDVSTNDPVRHQYEAYPYPLRDPEDERIRLLVRGPEFLPQINHFVFGGRQSFGPGSRILVAGGGTGDETVFFAEQLRDRGGMVAYLDQSEASMAIAKQRVAMRGLTNVEFHRGRIEEVSRDVHGSFDYIHSIGVLHHIADPELGLQRLAALLRPEGGMGILLYAPHGRRGNYQLQDMAKLVFAPEQPLPSKVQEMVTIVGSLPPDHPFFRGADRNATLNMIIQDPNELVDMVLHARDRAFSVGEVHDFLGSAGLNLIEFVPFSVYEQHTSSYTLFYDPLSYVTEPGLVARLAQMPRRTRQEVAELMHGKMDLHCFYVGRSGSEEARVDAVGMTPFFLPQRKCFTYEENGLVMTDYAGKRYTLTVTPVQRMLFDLIDDRRTVAEILTEASRLPMAAGMQEGDLGRQFADLFGTLRGFNWIALRHASVTKFTNYDHLYYVNAGWVDPTSK